jgi:hypothetical protein
MSARADRQAPAAGPLPKTCIAAYSTNRYTVYLIAGALGIFVLVLFSAEFC